MKPELLEAKLESLLIATDVALPPAQTAPVRMAALQARTARRAATRAGAAALTAAAALFMVVTRPAGAPTPVADSATRGTQSEIASLEREAALIRRIALATVAERERARPAFLVERLDRHQQTDGTPAATENAAFLLYCEADRLARHAETIAIARGRYAAVAERFPGTIWARMASELINTTAPIEKG